MTETAPVIEIDKDALYYRWIDEAEREQTRKAHEASKVFICEERADARDGRRVSERGVGGVERVGDRAVQLAEERTAERDELVREVSRLKALLRRHGIDPSSGSDREHV